MREIDCTREFGPWHGTSICLAHYREEFWWKGGLVAWISLRCSIEERREFWTYRNTLLLLHAS